MDIAYIFRGAGNLLSQVWDLTFVAFGQHFNAGDVFLFCAMLVILTRFMHRMSM